MQIQIFYMKQGILNIKQYTVHSQLAKDLFIQITKICELQVLLFLLALLINDVIFKGLQWYLRQPI